MAVTRATPLDLEGSRDRLHVHICMQFVRERMNYSCGSQDVHVHNISS